VVEEERLLSQVEEEELLLRLEVEVFAELLRLFLVLSVVEAVVVVVSLLLLVVVVEDRVPVSWACLRLVNRLGMLRVCVW
jgi:hypothetical protein